ncbi:hypothetical protein [Lysinibacillus sp. 54212]|uniref:hypothetical protein n=1 Tax=Lysinibacillus sp. 54212 TaxID=3119829 RepID=UPI002FCA32C5
MINLALKDRDLLFENGDFSLIENEKDVAQCIEIDLGSNIGDWFLNLLSGTDHDLLLGKTTDAQARAEIFRVLGNEERIATINSVDVISHTKNREREILFDVTLGDGTNLREGVQLDVGP